MVNNVLRSNPGGYIGVGSTGNRQITPPWDRADWSGSRVYVPEEVPVDPGAISGVVAAASTVTGTLTGTGALTGSAASASTVSGTLTGRGALSGAVVSASTVTGTLTGRGALSGAIAAASSLAGDLTADAAPEPEPEVVSRAADGDTAMSAAMARAIRRRLEREKRAPHPVAVPAAPAAPVVLPAPHPVAVSAGLSLADLIASVTPPAPMPAAQAAPAWDEEDDLELLLLA